MSKKASDKATNSPNLSATHMTSGDQDVKHAPPQRLEVDEPVTEQQLAKLVDWMRTANSPLLLGDRENQTARNRSLNDGRPLKCRDSVWDTVRRSGTAIVAQTVNFDVLTGLPFASTMLDTASAVQGLSIRETAFYAWVAVRRTLDNHSLQNLDVNAATIEAAELYLVQLSVALMNTVPGHHFIFLDPHFGSSEDIVSHALRMVGQYESHEMDRKRLVVSIPASEEGIVAAQILEKEHDVATNLCFVSGFFHAVVCIEAGASFITFSCRLMDTIHEQQQKSDRFKFRKRSSQQSLGWQWLSEIQATAEYLTLNHCKTRSILADMCGKFAPELLGDTNSICIRDKFELERLDLRSTVCSGDSVLSFQARQMKYPTTFLTQGKGFLPSADEQTRLRASAILRHGVAAMRQAAKDLNRGVKTEILKYVRLQQLDATSLAAMYEEEVHAERVSHDNSLPPRFLGGHDRPGKSNPRADHVGYRIAQIQWDKPYQSTYPVS